ncbi:nicotinate-nicotinamide nucleotide adenylyltransferase [Aliiglaciecola litoralis]|uniref:Probable nicotinate-nucleotide adenylyltransferase n=1 Tax=Aliiglaciecola litoralis TaxID=582857 RepID=A0ABN1LDJ5_9ALTE
MHIAVFGSAFNPPTYGHQDAIKTILSQHPPFEKVLLVPSFHHAFGKTMLAYEQRVSLLKCFVRELADPRVHVCAVEDKIAVKGKPVYTYDLLDYLQRQHYPKDKLTFVIGPDNLDNWHKFYRAEEVLTRWQRLVVPQHKDIRSTYVRDALAKGVSIEQWVPKTVAQYIQQHQLYV